ncbi:MAG: hypothetical protein ACK47N_02100 [Microcystis sp.]|uniref:hypothetical protein n=1 Tax=Microcystis TaxID=1125 RepID=UPI001680B1E0|nr:MULTISPECIES: hypothetical protein [Microcystis]NCQ91818.1 hypothetical protein [Microcystis aeruginosa LG13-13]NCR04989.1 hypothetical protein [Microcystis aeruginosa LG13-03]NCR63241.1 hypothetical protein [Microcystis aeruginosa LG11-05]NCR71849.1 hypothetical protein [Microcystis aeruginosa LG13-12]MBD2288416.1 hypothetical protein [Microcystis wesenbergii FACHB-1317]
MLGLTLQKWLNQGLWIIGRGEDIYLKCLKQKLKHLAPHYLGHWRSLLAFFGRISDNWF